MALPLKMNFSNSLKKLVFLRVINHGSIFFKSPQYSSQMSEPIKKRAPVKYTTNEAYKIRISETLGFQEENEEEKNFKTSLPKYIVVFSTFGAFAYFAYFREENEIDQIIKGESPKSIEHELIDLKIKLNYCKQMKLPTDAIRARIEELENSKPHKSSFPK